MQEDIKKLAAECIDLNVRLSRRLPKDVQFLIWTCPMSVRNPEISTFWHPIHSKKTILPRLFAYSFSLGFSCVRGLYKFFRYKGFYYRHINNNSSALLILPENITDGTNNFKTNYLTETAEEPVDKLVFSHSAEKISLGFRFSVLNYFVKGALLLKLLAGIAGDFKEQLFRRRVTKEYMDALIIFASWLLAQSWYFAWDFYHLINKIATSKDYNLFLALHEMHFYSKVIWKVANERGLLGVTAQHALIVPEKLWYFPEEAEVKANCPLPDVFFVYSDEISEVLSPLYPKTQFFKCCSPRFKRWKSYPDVSIKHNKAQNNKPVILIANNAAILHDNVVLQALRRLVGQRLNNVFTLRLRLHPTERLNLRDQLWVRAAAILHRIEISFNSLQEDFNEADLVIGANSTVVYEALLTGVPVMGVFDDYHVRSSIIPYAFTCNINNLSLSSLEIYMNKAVDNDIIRRFKENIGAFSPDFTTKLVYDACSSA